MRNRGRGDSIVCAGVGACNRHAGEGKCIRVLVGKAEGKRPLGRPRRRWEDLANVDVKVIGCGVVYWVNLPQKG